MRKSLEQSCIYFVHYGLPGCLPNYSYACGSMAEANRYIEEMRAEYDDSDTENNYTDPCDFDIAESTISQAVKDCDIETSSKTTKREILQKINEMV
jgi:hypothetical protein